MATFKEKNWICRNFGRFVRSVFAIWYESDAVMYQVPGTHYWRGILDIYTPAPAT